MQIVFEGHFFFMHQGFFLMFKFSAKVKVLSIA